MRKVLSGLLPKAFGSRVSNHTAFKNSAPEAQLSNHLISNHLAEENFTSAGLEDKVKELFKEVNSSAKIHSPSITEILINEWAKISDFTKGDVDIENLDINIQYALEIKKSAKKPAIRAEEYQIGNRSDAFHTSGLAFCNALLFLGKDKAALLHISKRDDNLVKFLFNEIDPEKVVALQSNITEIDNIQALSFSREMKEGGNFLKQYAESKNSKCNFEFITYDSSVDKSDRVYLFFKGKSNEKEEDKMVILKEREENILEKIERQKSSQSR